MLMVVISLLPATFFGIWNFRHENAWILIVLTTAAAVLAEYLWEKLMHKPVTIKDFSAVVTGLLLALNLPPTLPWWMGVVGAFFAIIVVKQLQEYERRKASRLCRMQRKLWELWRLHRTYRKV